jgi:hypothetical protein
LTLEYKSDVTELNDSRVMKISILNYDWTFHHRDDYRYYEELMM